MNNRFFRAVVIFFITLFIINIIFTWGKHQGIEIGRKQMFIEMQIILKKAGVEIIDGGKFKPEN